MPPTDNIYKFLAISGLLIYLFSGNLAVNQFVKYREVKNAFLKDSIILSNELKQDSILIAQFEFHLIKEDYSYNELAEDNFVESYTIHDKENQFKVQKLKANIQMNKELILNAREGVKDKWHYTKKTVSLFAIALLFGSVLSSLGFYFWHKRIQAPIEKERGLDAREPKSWLYVTICIAFIAANIAIIIYLGKK